MRRHGEVRAVALRLLAEHGRVTPPMLQASAGISGPLSNQCLRRYRQTGWLRREARGVYVRGRCFELCRPIRDRLLDVLGATPTSTLALAHLLDETHNSVRVALSRMARRGLVVRARTGMYAKASVSKPVTLNSRAA